MRVSYMIKEPDSSCNVNLLVHLGIQINFYGDIGLIGFAIDGS